MRPRATTGIVTQASQLGLSQERVDEGKRRPRCTDKHHSEQARSISRAWIPAEASTLVNTLQTQLETAYTIVSKIQQLSLVNYL